MKIGLCILNRNEADALPHVLGRLPHEAVDAVIAVDGNSTDASPTLLREAGIEVVPQGDRLGRGEAFRVAFERLREEVDAVIFFSPDGNEAPEDIARFRPLLEAGHDLVIASRMMAGAVNEEDHQVLKLRKWANNAFSELARPTWGRGRRPISDPINGFRAMTVSAWDQMRPDGAGYTIEYQTSIRAYELGLSVAEFPTVEGQRIGGASGARSIPTGIHFLKLYAHEVQRTWGARGAR